MSTSNNLAKFPNNEAITGRKKSKYRDGFGEELVCVGVVSGAKSS